jgi:hypothetical protein
MIGFAATQSTGGSGVCGNADLQYSSKIRVQLSAGSNTLMLDGGFGFPNLAQISFVPIDPKPPKYATLKPIHACIGANCPPPEIGILYAHLDCDFYAKQDRLVINGDHSIGFNYHVGASVCDGDFNYQVVERHGWHDNQCGPEVVQLACENPYPMASMAPVLAQSYDLLPPIERFHDCSSGVCQNGNACVDNGGDGKFYCKPFCTSDADCSNLQIKGLKCFQHKRADGSTFPKKVCNDVTSSTHPYPQVLPDPDYPSMAITIPLLSDR